VKEYKQHEQGVGLIVIIMILAFLLSVGLVVVTTTSTGSQVAGNVRWQQMAFSAAEAGFDASWMAIEGFFSDGIWTSFDNYYLQEPVGIDIPYDAAYFRRLTDEELLNLIGDFDNGSTPYANIIFYKQEFIPQGSGFDPRFTYTAFLIDDEAYGAASDPSDVVLVCIGAVEMGGRLITTRLEIELVVELPGT